MGVERPHALAPEQIAQALDVDLDRGLDEPTAADRLHVFGPNRLPRARRPAYVAIALRQFTDPLVLLLIAAALLEQR